VRGINARSSTQRGDPNLRGWFIWHLNIINTPKCQFLIGIVESWLIRIVEYFQSKNAVNPLGWRLTCVTEIEPHNYGLSNFDLISRATQGHPSSLFQSHLVLHRRNIILRGLGFYLSKGNLLSHMPSGGPGIIGGVASLLPSNTQLTLKDKSRPKCSECDHQGQTHSQIIGDFRLLPMQVETSEPSDDRPGHLGLFWKLVFALSIIAWVGGGITVWRGAHIADDFLSGGLVLIGIGLCFLVLGLWLLRKVFLKTNPWLSPAMLHNTVPQKYLLTTFNYWGTVIAVRAMNMANVLPTEKRIAVISALAEGSGIRQIERMTGINRNTIMNLGVRVGQGCASLLDRKMQNLPCEHLQFDELWGFIGKKQKHVQPYDNPDCGDVWTFCAIDSDTKLVPSFKVGKRDAATANAFVGDVAGRLANRVQISTDGLHAYVEAVERAFGSNVDYAQIVKVFDDQSMDAEVIGMNKAAFAGRPNMGRATTSHVERLNGTTRLHMRRLTRLTYAFSKKKENFEAAVALHFAYYNFVKRHNSLRMTPAMAAGIERDFWTVGNLVEAAV
jgi:IS1 family transposase